MLIQLICRAYMAIKMKEQYSFNYKYISRNVKLQKKNYTHLIQKFDLPLLFNRQIKTLL